MRLFVGCASGTCIFLSPPSTCGLTFKRQHIGLHWMRRVASPPPPPPPPDFIQFLLPTDRGTHDKMPWAPRPKDACPGALLATSRVYVSYVICMCICRAPEVRRQANTGLQPQMKFRPRRPLGPAFGDIPVASGRSTCRGASRGADCPGAVRADATASRMPLALRADGADEESSPALQPSEAPRGGDRFLKQFEKPCLHNPFT